MRHMRRTHAHTKVFCQDRTGDMDVLSMTSDKFRGDQAAASAQRSLGQRYIWDSLYCMEGGMYICKDDDRAGLTSDNLVPCVWERRSSRRVVLYRR